MKFAFYLFVTLSIFTSTHADGLTNPITKWSFQTDGPIRGSAVVSGERIYFGSSDGNLYAANKANGTLIWKFQTGGAIAGMPAVTDSLAVVSGRGKTVYAVDIETGREKWSFNVGVDVPADNEWNYFTASPVVDGDQVLVGSGDGYLYSLNLKNGKLRWKFKTQDSVRAAPLVVGDTVYQPSCDDFVYVLSAKDGSLKWKFETEGATIDRGTGFIRSDIFTKPAVRDGLLIFGSRDSKVYAVDIETHEKKWDFNYDSTWAMSTTIDEDTVYVGWSTNNMVTALDLSTGEKKWDHKAGSHTYTSGLRLGEDVYWGCADGNVYSFNHESGALNWTYNVGTQIHSSPASDDDGTLYFGSDNGRLYALTNASAPSRKAVYFPSDIPQYATGFVLDSAVAPYLTERGFELLDSSRALVDFLNEQSSGGAPSVVVFAYLQVPFAALGEEPSNGPLRSYLETGGKVVWQGGMDYLYCFDDSGNFVGRDQSYATRLLDIELIYIEDGGSYYSKPTQEGRNLGFPVWLKSSWASLPADSDVTPLAINEYGNIGAWAKAFNSRYGSGWVSFSTKEFGVPITESELQLIERVASYTLD